MGEETRLAAGAVGLRVRLAGAVGRVLVEELHLDERHDGRDRDEAQRVARLQQQDEHPSVQHTLVDLLLALRPRRGVAPVVVVRGAAVVQQRRAHVRLAVVARVHRGRSAERSGAREQRRSSNRSGSLSGGEQRKNRSRRSHRLRLSVAHAAKLLADEAYADDIIEHTTSAQLR